jgi:hypothetical protein
MQTVQGYDSSVHHQLHSWPVHAHETAGRFTTTWRKLDRFATRSRLALVDPSGHDRQSKPTAQRAIPDQKLEAPTLPIL